MEQASDLSLPLIYRGVGYEYDILSNPLLQTNCFVRCRQRLVFVVLEFEFVVFRVPVGITLGYEILMTSRNQYSMNLSALPSAQLVPNAAKHQQQQQQRRRRRRQQQQLYRKYK